MLSRNGYGYGADLWSLGVVLYVMLCGYAPFYDERGSRRAVNNKILAGAFEFQSPWWDDISGEAKLLIRKLLVLDPQLRPSAEKVFEDPWLRDPTCDVHIPSFSANWRKYRLKRKFKAAVLALVARDRMLNITFTPGSVASLQSRRSSLDSLPSDPTPLNRIRTSSLSGGGMTNLGAVQGDGIAGIDSLDMAVMGRGLSHALGDQAMSMSIDDIGFSERG